MDCLEHSPTRILIVEDDVLFRDEVAALIESGGQFAVTAQAATLQQAYRCVSVGTSAAEPDLVHEVAFDVAVVDVGLPDGDGVELVRWIKGSYPNVRCLIMTVFEDHQTALAAFSAGADGYVVKTSGDFVGHLAKVARGEHPIDAKVAGVLLQNLREQPDTPEVLCDPLSPREHETLRALAQGMTYHQIAVELGVSVHTVPDYIKNLYRKLGVNSRSEAVYEAVQQGLITMLPRSKGVVATS